MRLVLVGALLLQSGGDSWFGVDKLKHFFDSAFVQSVSYSALRTLDVGHDRALVGASCVTATFAVGKELYDARRGSFFSARDLVWDVAGAGTATLLLDGTRR